MEDTDSFRTTPFSGSLRNIADEQPHHLRMTSPVVNAPRIRAGNNYRSRSQSQQRSTSASPDPIHNLDGFQAQDSSQHSENHQSSSTWETLDKSMNRERLRDEAEVDKENENDLSSFITVMDDYKTSIFNGNFKIFLISLANALFIKMLCGIYGRTRVTHESILALYILTSGVMSSTIHRLIYWKISDRQEIAFVDHVILSLQSAPQATFFHFIDNSVAIAYVLWRTPERNGFSLLGSALFHVFLTIAIILSCRYRYAHAYWIRHPSNLLESLRFSEQYYMSNFFQAVTTGVLSQAVRLSLVYFTKENMFLTLDAQHHLVIFAAHFYTFSGIFFYHVQQLNLA